jgi:hypothetical protein
MRQPVAVSDADWIAEDEAARTIGIPAQRIHWLKMNGHLTVATRSDGARGITRMSMEAEVRWRRDASFGRRAKRVIGCVFTWSP